MIDFGQCERIVPPGRPMREGRRCKRRALVMIEQERSRPLAMCRQHAHVIYAMRVNGFRGEA